MRESECERFRRDGERAVVQRTGLLELSKFIEFLEEANKRRDAFTSEASSLNQQLLIMSDERMRKNSHQSHQSETQTNIKWSKLIRNFTIGRAALFNRHRAAQI